ncbi:MAG: TCR/Tet family MFS transporter [Hyphomonadaceae bacterium JAD_PAG50586_4]|nr:MAG: TCR/Tet family MFS transporter [Hyphomonadaceae bacterium JAD_PAG50586_4]
MRAPGKHALAFIFFTVLIDTIGFGIIMPVMPQLLVELTGQPLAYATLMSGFLLTTYAVLQFVCGPIMGNLSDRFGRRPVLLLSLAAFAIDYMLMGFAPTLAWLFVGRAIAGMAGAVYSPAMAYIADVSAPEKRAQSFGMMGAAFGVGFIVGPLIGGLLGELGPRAPFFAAAGLAALNFAYGYFVLPESLAKERRRPFEWKRANPLGTLLALKRYPAVMGLAGAVLLWQLAHQVYPATWSFFAKIRFDWSEAAIGASLTFVGVLMAFTQGYLTGKIVPRIGEQRAVIIGLVSGAASMLMLAFATQAWFAYVAMAAGALQGLAYPSMNAIMSKQVPPEQQGELQGGVSAMMSLTMIFGPLVMTQILGRFSGAGAPISFPGAAFLLAAILALCALLIVLRLRRAPEPSRLPETGAAG